LNFCNRTVTYLGWRMPMMVCPTGEAGKKCGQKTLFMIVI
jgi:hypothetical protein